MNSRTGPRKALAERSDFIGAKTFSLTIRLGKKSNAKKKKKVLISNHKAIQLLKNGLH